MTTVMKNILGMRINLGTTVFFSQEKVNINPVLVTIICKKTSREIDSPDVFNDDIAPLFKYMLGFSDCTYLGLVSSTLDGIDKTGFKIDMVNGQLDMKGCEDGEWVISFLVNKKRGG